MLLFLASALLRAQTPTPSTSGSAVSESGPTIEQTIAFINEKLPKGQLVRPEGSCGLIYSSSFIVVGSGKESVDRILLFLDRTDPLSVSVGVTHNTYPTGYEIRLERAVFERQAGAFTDPAPVSTPRQLLIGPFFDSQDTANRVAKALIHAMVLCHKDEKPSLF